MRAYPTLVMLARPLVLSLSFAVPTLGLFARTPVQAQSQPAQSSPAQPAAAQPAAQPPAQPQPPAQAPTQAAPPPAPSSDTHVGEPSLTPLPGGFPTPPPPAPGAASAPPAPPVAQAVGPAPALPGAPPQAPAVPSVPPPDTRAAGDRAPIYRPGQGFVLATDDGDFELGISLMGQARYRYIDDGDHGLHVADVRHTRVRLSGHLFGPHNHYFVQLAFAPDEVGRARFPLPDTSDPILATDLVSQSPLYDLVLRFDHLSDANLQVGQFRVPFSRTRVLAPERLLFSDRGLVNATFNLDRDIGLAVLSDDFLGLELLRYRLGAFIGEGRNASAATTGAGDRGLLFTARAELLPLGFFDTDDVVDFDRGSTPRIAIGAGFGAFEGDAASPAAAAYVGAPYVDADEPPLVDFSAINLTADALFKYQGFSVLGAFHLRTVDPVVQASEGVGVEISAGYLLEPVPVSLGLRFGAVRIIDDASLLAEQDEFSVAVGYHLFENLLKAQVGYTHRWTHTFNPAAPPPLLPEGDELALQLTATL